MIRRPSPTTSAAPVSITSEAVGRITLAKHRLAGRHVERFQAAREVFDSRQR